MGRRSRQKRERREHGEGPVARVAHGRSRASLLALLEAASVSPNASQYLPSLGVVFESLANGRTRVGGRPAELSLLEPLVRAAHRECPSAGAEEDFVPHDPRFDVRVDWAEQMFRMVAGSLERPTSDIETLRRLSAIIDPVLHEHTDYGLADVVELILRRVHAVACALAPTWPADHEQVLGSPPQLSAEELVAAAGVPPLEDQIAQCSSPERARAALQAHSVPAKKLRRDEMSMVASFGDTIAVRHGQNGFTSLPTGLIVEAFNALAGELAAKALAVDPSLDYEWLKAGWRYIGGMLDAAGLDVIGPIEDERYPYLHSVIRYCDSQYLAISVVGGLDHGALQEKIGIAASHLETVRAGSTLTAASGPAAIPASARLCRLVIVAQPQAAMLLTPHGAKCALVTLQDLDWIRRTIGRDEIDLWYFVRDRVRQPRIGQLRAWDGIDLWEAWRGSGKSFYRGGHEVDVLYVEPHHSRREWRKAAEQRDVETALAVLGMGRISAWPIHSLEGESKLVGNARKGASFRLLVGETPVAVALHPRAGTEPTSALARKLGECIAHKLECVRDRFTELMRSGERRSLQIQFAFEHSDEHPTALVARLDGNVLTFDCSPSIVELLQSDSQSVEAQFGLLLAEAITGGISIGDFTTAWNVASPGIRFDAFSVGPRVQETPEAASLHESHRSTLLAELGAHLQEAGIAAGVHRGHDAKGIETAVVVPWLTDRLHQELAQFDCSAVLRLALTQLEYTNCSRWWKIEKSAYRAGSPSDDDRLSGFSRDLLAQTRAINLMIEEILARPPTGTKTPTEYDWQVLLSLATLIREASFHSEALHLELAGAALHISAHYEVSISEEDTSLSIDMEAFERDRSLAALPDPVPIGTTNGQEEQDQEWTPIEVHLPEYEAIERALKNGLGFGTDAIMGILDSAIHWPVSAPQCTELVTIDEIAADAHGANPAINLAAYTKAANWLSLGTNDFDPADPNIEHWEIERRSARIAIRPLAREEAHVWVSPWSAVVARRTWVNYLSQHRMPIRDAELPEQVATAFEKARQKRQRKFEKECLSRLNGLPLVNIAPVLPRHALRHGIQHLSGEIDILSISSERSIIFVIEAKDPFVPLSARSINQQTNDFHKAGGHIDKLDQKVRDIEASAKSLAANKGVNGPDREWSVASIMVTRHVTPAAYVRACSTAFCTIDTLRDTVEGFGS